MYRTAFLLVVILFFAVGCNTTLPTTTIPLPEEIVSMQESLWGLEWREDGVYLLLLDNLLYRWHNNEWEQQLLPQRATCRRTFYGSLFSLSDGRFAMSQVCFGDKDKYNILVYDWGEQQGEFLLAQDLQEPGVFTNNPDMTSFIYQTFNAFGIPYWINGEQLDPIPITLVDGDKSWFLPSTIAIKEQWENDEARIDKRVYHAGLLGATVWSPDGRWLALTATLDPMGKPLATLGRYQWNLYLVNPETLESTILVEGINDSGALFGWSPDSRWIGYKEGGSGVWIADVNSGARHNIYRGRVYEVTWSPDGRSILVTNCKTVLCDSFELVIIDVSSIIEAP